MSWAAIVVAGVGAAVKIGSGIAQKNKAKKLLRGLKEEQVPDEVLQNQRLAQSMAGQGLPSEQYAMAMKNIQRQQLTAIKGAHDRRAGVGSIAPIQQATNDANLDLDSRDAQMKIANQRNLMAINNQVAGWKSKIVGNKFNRDYNYAMSLKGAGNQNITGGIDQAASGVASGLSSGAFGGSGGRTRGGRTGRPNYPTYYNGYSGNSQYSDYQTGFE